jgi:hypothetical protein
VEVALYWVVQDVMEQSAAVIVATGQDSQADVTVEYQA